MSIKNFIDRMVGGNQSVPADPSKRGITNTIENENLDLVMCPSSLMDFNTGTTVIVRDSEVALFIEGGSIAGYIDQPTPKKGISLTTSNYPGLRAIAEIFNGGVTQYKCKVVYVRTNILERPLLWGSPVGIGRIIDSTTGVTWNYKGTAEFKIRVVDPKAFYRQFGIRPIGFDDLDTFLRHPISSALQAALQIALCCKGNSPEKWISLLRIEKESDFKTRFISMINADEALSGIGVELVTFSCDLQLCDDNLSNYDKDRNLTIAELQRRTLLGDDYASSEMHRIMHETAQSSTAASNLMGISMGGILGNNLAATVAGPDSQDPWGNQPGYSPKSANGPKDYDDLMFDKIERQKQILRKAIKQLDEDINLGLVDQATYDETKRKYQEEYKRLLCNF